MARKIEWHTYQEKPQPNTLVLVNRGPVDFFVDTIGENFDEWADDVIKWAYIYYGNLDNKEKSNEKDIAIIDSVERFINPDIFGDAITNLANRLRSANDSRECNSDGSESSDVSDNDRRAIYSCIKDCRKLLEQAYEGEFSVSIEDLRRIHYILSHHRDKKPIDYDALGDSYEFK